jgi:hypothetical protein
MTFSALLKWKKKDDFVNPKGRGRSSTLFLSHNFEILENRGIHPRYLVIVEGARKDCAARKERRLTYSSSCLKYLQPTQHCLFHISLFLPNIITCIFGTYSLITFFPTYSSITFSRLSLHQTCSMMKR